jgi:hypothetical protein
VLPFTPGGSGKLLVCGYSRYIVDDAARPHRDATLTRTPVVMDQASVERSNTLAGSASGIQGGPAETCFDFAAGISTAEGAVSQRATG